MKYTANLHSNELEHQYSKETDLTHRKAHGQFFTPYSVATFMAEWLLTNPKETLNILDPATGLGILERALDRLNQHEKKNIHCDLWEIDPRVTDKLRTIVEGLEITATVMNEDFMESGWDLRYDGIIANPPYIKHRVMSNNKKILNDISSYTNHTFNLQTNIYCWFLIKCFHLLNPGGKLAFIIPSEFLNANYGKAVKEYIKNIGLVVHVITVHFETNVFDNVLTTSVIILAEKGPTKSTHINFYNVNHIDELNSLSAFLHTRLKRQISAGELDSHKKWRNYFLPAHETVDTNKLVPFTTYGRFKRGIATGANDYFTLSPEDVKRYQLPSTVVLPCVTKATQVKDICFSETDFTSLASQNKKIYVFDGEKSSEASVTRYLSYGETQGIHTRFLTKHRNPWYALEKKPVSNMWVGVFGRDELRFIWNSSQCLNLTCFHGFYPTDIGEEYMDILFLYLTTPSAKKLLETERREYGNGLKKYEPNDINHTLVFNFTHLSEEEHSQLAALQKEFIVNKDRRSIILEEAESIFQKVFLAE